MDINVQQLNKLNGEIDAVNIRIDAEKAEWKKATTAEDKAFYTQSILRLDDEKKALIDNRKQLTTTNASSSSQGKDISTAVSPRKALLSIYANCCYSTRVFKSYRLAFAFDLYWCIRERLRRQWGVYHNITPPIRDSTSRWCVWIKVCDKNNLWVFAFRFFSYVFN